MHKRTLISFSLALAMLVVACDEPVGPESTGTMVLRFVVPTPLDAELTTLYVDRPSGLSEPEARDDALLGASEENLDNGGRVLEGIGGDVDATNAVDSSHTETPVQSASMVGTIESARAVVSGPTNKIVQLTVTPDSITGVIDGLAPGTYAVFVEGLIGGEVDYFGQATSVQVSSGTTARATIVFGTFRPDLSGITQTSTTLFSFVVPFAAVPGATSYEVEWDVDPAFSAPDFNTSMTPGVAVFLFDLGTYYYRARSLNSNSTNAGRWSAPNPIDIVALVRGTPTAPFGTLVTPILTNNADSVLVADGNIIGGVSHWFSAAVCTGDTLSIDVLAERLNPPSPLDAVLRIRRSDPDTTTLAENDDTFGLDPSLEYVAANADTVRIEVVGFDSSEVGNFDLVVRRGAGENRDGMGNCGPFALSVTPGIDTIVGVDSTLALNANLVNATGGMTTGPLSWGVTTFGTVTVDAAGVVTAVGQGTTGVYAVSTENGLADTAVISVQVPNRIDVMPTGATFFLSGENFQYTATLLDQGGNTVAPSRFSMGWGSYNTDVFTIDGGGLATSANSGQGVVQATVFGLEGNALGTVAVSGTTPVTAWDTITTNPLQTWGWSAWGRDAATVYAVGASGGAGEFNGSGWSPITAPTTFEIRDAWGAAGNAFWTVGGGQILHYDGGVWQDTVTEPSGNLWWDMWGAGPNDIHAVGAFEFIHYDGTSWSVHSTIPAEFQYGIWGASRDTVYSVGNACSVYRYDGSDWTQMATPGCPDLLYRVWGTSGDNVYAVGNSGRMMHYDGIAWDTLPTVTTNSLFGIWGTGPDEIFASGSGSTIVAYDGTRWFTMPSGAVNTYDVWGNSVGDFHGVWDGGVLRGYRGTSSANYGVQTVSSPNVSWISNILLLTPVTVTATTDITELSVGNTSTANTNMILAVYSDVAGSPNTLLGQTDPGVLTAAGIFTLPLQNRIRLVPGTYWVGHYHDVGWSPDATGAPGGPGYQFMSLTWGTPLPVTFTPGTLFDGTFAYYMTGFVVP